jgi:hypothetical protein
MGSEMDTHLRDQRDIVRDEMLMRDEVLAVLRDGPKTIPEMAAALARPVREVTLWVMSARRYGYVEELKEPTNEGYYKYRLAQECKHSGNEYAKSKS